jgi:4-amino-4-deoxy-L-arabinose transferase-like glycosyltransferase
MKTSISQKVLLIFLILRLLLVCVTVTNPQGGILSDSLAYLDLTKSILESGRYESQLYEDEDLLRPPIYPYFLATIQTLFGSKYAYVTFIQLVLSGLISLMIFYVGRLIGHERVGIVAAWLFALSPNIALWSLMIMTETLFSFFIAIAIMVWVKYLQSSKILWLALVGIALGLATLVRPIGLYLIFLWVVLALVGFWRTHGIKRAVGPATLLLMSGLMIILPWMIRNWRVHNQFAISSVSTKTFVEFNLAYVIADLEGIDRDEAVMRIDAGGNLISYTFELFREKPVAFLRTQAFGIARSLVGSETGTWAMAVGGGSWDGFGVLTSLFNEQDNKAEMDTPISVDDKTSLILLGLFFYSLIHSTVLLGLILPSLFLFMKANQKERILISSFLLISAYLIIVPGAAGQARFRVPAEPALALLAGFGWTYLWMKIRSPREFSSVEDTNIK